MALVICLILLQVLLRTTSASPVNKPFEVYGPPPTEGSLLSPEERDTLPQNAPEATTLSPIDLPSTTSSSPLLETAPETTVPEWHTSPPRNDVKKPNRTSSVKPSTESPQVIVVQDIMGQYSFGVNQPGREGQTIKEQGRLISTNDGWEYVIAKRGSYSYISPEGVPITVEWEADHNGFRILKS